jgi:hypothetical protein
MPDLVRMARRTCQSFRGWPCSANVGAEQQHSEACLPTSERGCFAGFRKDNGLNRCGALRGPAASGRTAEVVGRIRHINVSWELSALIVVGSIRLVIGLHPKVGTLSTIGVILLIPGAALWVVDAVGHAVGGRAHSW